MFLSLVLTKAPPLPGLTCWKNRIVNRLPSTRIADPFLNWLVDIMLENSPSRRPIFAADLRGVNPSQTPGYYRTVSLPVSHVRGHESGSGERGSVCLVSGLPGAHVGITAPETEVDRVAQRTRLW